MTERRISETASSALLHYIHHLHYTVGSNNELNSMVYYDVFADREEEEFSLMEQIESQKMIDSILAKPTEDLLLDFPFPIDRLQDLLRIGTICSIKVRYWGFGDRGLEIIAENLDAMPNLRHLSFRCCGISVTGIDHLLQAMALSTTRIEALDFSHNNLLQKTDLFGSSLSRHLPGIQNLRRLELSATNLPMSTMKALWTVSSSNCQLEELDISNNHESLTKVLDALLIYLPRFNHLRRLVLARGNNSATCIDYNSDQSLNSQSILQRLSLELQSCPLEFLGPLSLLPLDRQAGQDTQMQYKACKRWLELINFFLLRNRCIRRLHVSHGQGVTNVLPLVLADCDRPHSDSLKFSLIRECVGSLVRE